MQLVNENAWVLSSSKKLPVFSVNPYFFAKKLNLKISSYTRVYMVYSFLTNISFIGILLILFPYASIRNSGIKFNLNLNEAVTDIIHFDEDFFLLYSNNFLPSVFHNLQILDSLNKL